MPKVNPMNGLRELSTPDLIKLGEEKRAELFALKFQAVLGSLEQTHRIKDLKREIARVEMVLGEKKAAGENTNQAIKADYSKVVGEADAKGKKVRKEKLKQIQEAYGLPEIDEAAIAQAMEQSSAVEAPEAEPKVAVAKKPAVKKTSKGEDK